MITKTERIYLNRTKKWYKHGSFDKELITVKVKRITIRLFFIPIFWTEEIIADNL